MHSMPYTIAIAGVLALYLLLDTIVIVRTGHVPGLFRGRLAPRMPYGPITRKGRPNRFWVYVGSNITVLLMATGYIATVLIFS